MSRRARAWAILGIALHLFTLGCAMYLSDTRPEVADGTTAWQCTTPTPVPTRVIGYAERTEVNPLGTAEVVSEPVYSEPAPTATPYIRTGADFFAGQRAQALPGLTLSATSDGRSVRLTVENATGAPLELHTKPSYVRAVRRPDGRTVAGDWYPIQDFDGLWPPGTTTRTLQFGPDLPEGTIQAWGLPLLRADQLRAGQTGGRQFWVTFARDPDCAGDAGGPPSDAYDAAPERGAPIFGRVGYPVPAGTTISRGFGCHVFYTGVRGACGGLWFHDGIDYVNRRGASVFAIGAGRVVYAGRDTSAMDCSWMAGSEAPHAGYGLYVLLDLGAGVTALYAHLGSLDVSAGDMVAGGQRLGGFGSTGCSTGVHTHFRILVNGLPRNPFDFISSNG